MSSPWRYRAASLAGRLAARTLRRLGRGGTALPGLIAQAVAPDFVRRRASRLPSDSVLITGTNGKTTTARLLAEMARQAGWHPIHNAAGSNLLRGIASAFLQRRDGPLPTLGIFEVDEATLPLAIEALSPRFLVLLNLFRDQLDRYGEVDSVAARWRAAIEGASEGLRLVLNADDPLVASLGRGRPALFFGLEDWTLGHEGLDHASDARWCPHCGAELAYSCAFYGHIGHYRCPGCRAARPQPQIFAQQVKLEGVQGSWVQLRGAWGQWEGHLALPGLYNVSNALAALAAAQALEMPPEAMAAALQSASAAFGRGEVIEVEGRQVHLLLVKNPVGMSQVARAVAGEGPRLSLLFALNDGIADGRDVSWIWDVDLSPLAERCERVSISGHRAAEMALRLRAAGLLPSAEGAWGLEPRLAVALRQAIAATPPGGRLFVLPTYTAMLQARSLLARWGGVAPFWEQALS